MSAQLRARKGGLRFWDWLPVIHGRCRLNRLRGSRKGLWSFLVWTLVRDSLCQPQSMGSSLHSLSFLARAIVSRGSFAVGTSSMTWKMSH